MEYTIRCTEKELMLISKALDAYARIGAGRLNYALDNELFKQYMENYFTDKRNIEVGDNTNCGKVFEINGDKVTVLVSTVVEDAYMQVKKIVDIKDVKLSPNHYVLQMIMADLRNKFDEYKGTGLYDDDVPDGAVTAFHLHQQIRHKLYIDNNETVNYSIISAYPADSCQLKGIDEPNFKIEKL